MEEPQGDVTQKARDVTQVSDVTAGFGDALTQGKTRPSSESRSRPAEVVFQLDEGQQPLSALAARLRNVPAFSTLGDIAIEALSGRARVIDYESGAKIISRGDRGASVFAILQGSVEIRVPAPDGTPRITTRLGQGEVFGEMALLTGEPRFADVVVPEASRCECVRFDADEMKRLMYERPAVARFLSDVLGDRLLQSESMRNLGKYRLVSAIGRGGMSRVFEGYHAELERVVAIKMLDHTLAFQDQFLDRFLTEARIVAELNHPNIVQVFDVEQRYGTCFIVMERLRGEDLGSVVKTSGPMAFDQVRSVVLQAAAALDSAHTSSIIHRDIKPENLFLEPDGKLKLVDFGIASTPGTTDGDDKRAYTPGYAAPELILNKPIDNRIDIYALGLTAWTLLTGKSWAIGETINKTLRKHLDEQVPPPSDFVQNVPADLSRFVARATQKRAEVRYRNCAEILDELRGEDSVEVPANGKVVMIATYPSGRANEVNRLVAEFRKRLNQIPDVEATSGEMHPTE